MSAKEVEREESKHAESKVSMESYRSEAKGGEEKGLAPDSKEAELVDDSVITKFQEFFFGNDELAGTFEKFVKDNCHIIDLGSEEYKLEYTAVFEDYKQLFEQKMESYIVKELHCSVQGFYEALKRKMEEGETSNEAVFGQILIAVTDFDVFMTMMREGAREMSESGHK